MKTTEKRTYRKITPSEIARHKALEVLHGNGTQAVRYAYPQTLTPHDRAWRIQKKADEQNSVDFIDQELQQIGIDAVNRIGLLVNSLDEKVATKNAHYVVDHLRGKPLQRSETKHLALTIEAVL